MKAICIDSSNKPEHISENEWIEEGSVYTITQVVEIGVQEGKLGISLEEIELTEASAPYKYYSLERFLIVPEILTVGLKAYNEDDLDNIRTEIFNEEEEEKDIYAEDADLTNSI
jgi:hypothetical protein